MLDHDNWPASRLQTLAAFVSDETLRSHLQVVMIKTLDTAFRWETPSLTEISADAPTLDRPADLQAFVEHFTAEPVTVSVNKGCQLVDIIDWLIVINRWLADCNLLILNLNMGTLTHHSI